MGCVQPKVKPPTEESKQSIKKPSIAQFKYESEIPKIKLEPIMDIISKENFLNIYILDPIIVGKGQFGTVRLGILKTQQKCKTDIKKRFAIKSVPIQKYENNLYHLLNELFVLKQCDHPNIIKFYETYKDQRNVHIVMEYCSGGDLKMLTSENKYLSENKVRSYMQQLFSALVYLHQRKIMHRDLKIENCLISNRNDECEIKLIDFGLSEIVNKSDEKIENLCGSFLYFGPELFRGVYDNIKSDLWSSGVIMYYLLIGEFPFQDNDCQNLINKINSGQFDKNSVYWEQLSENAKDLILMLLEVNVDKRLNAFQALQHPFFEESFWDSITDLKAIDNQVLLNLIRYPEMPRLKKEVWKILINFVDESKISKLRTIFRSFDIDDDGVISLQDLQYVYNQKSINVSKQVLQDMISKIEIDTHNQYISYTSFLIAIIDRESVLKDQQKKYIKLLFSLFDISESGQITKENLQSRLIRLGRDMPEVELEQIIQEVDFGNTQTINYINFRVMMENDDVEIMKEKYAQLFNSQQEQLKQKQKSCQPLPSSTNFREDDIEEGKKTMEHFQNTFDLIENRDIINRQNSDLDSDKTCNYQTLSQHKQNQSKDVPSSVDSNQNKHSQEVYQCKCTKSENYTKSEYSKQQQQ